MKNDLRVGFHLASSTLKRSNRKTSALTVLVLAAIFMNLLFLPALINGMQDMYVDMMTDVYGDISIEPMKDQQFIDDADLLLQKLRSNNHVIASTKRLSSGATLTYKEKFVGASIVGVVPDEERHVSGFHNALTSGDYLTGQSDDEILLGIYLAGEEDGTEIIQGLGGVQTGDLINVTYSNGIIRQYKVKGIMQDGALSDSFALITYNELASVLGIENGDKASSVVVKVDDKDATASIKNDLLFLGIKEDIKTWQEKIQDILKDVVEIFGMLTISTNVISIIIAIFVLFIIIYINTINKRRQIGILKAIGITRNSIIISRVVMSVFYTMLGMFFGGLLFLSTVYYFTQNPINYYGSIMLSPKIDPNAVIQNILILLTTALIAGFIPAWMITKEDILESIWGAA